MDNYLIKNKNTTSLTKYKKTKHNTMASTQIYQQTAAIVDDSG